VGNAVSVPVSKWIGERLFHPTGEAPPGELLKPGVAWPKAAWGKQGRVYSVPVSTWPVRIPAPHLREFLQFPTSPLSARAANGFHSRAAVSGLRFEEGFIADLKRHIDRMGKMGVPSNAKTKAKLRTA
jgi:DNA (cytosine-5)-methyltransferase 1